MLFEYGILESLFFRKSITNVSSLVSAMKLDNYFLIDTRSVCTL